MSIFHDFLSESAKLMSKSTPCHVRVVLGNEACDLDSSVCALVYAFFLSNFTKAKDEKPTIPVLNINREDYNLHTEVNYWLSKHSILSQDLVFRDDINLQSLFKSKCLDLVLVDHNVLSAVDSNMESAVKLILDHHKQERIDPPENGMVIAPVASCSTLVAQDIMNKAPEIMKYPVPELLYGTILLDSINFSESAKKTTPRDVAIFDQLLTFITNPLDRNKVYNEINIARSDITKLTSDECLRKDVKTLGQADKKVGIASLPILVQEYFKRHDVTETLVNHIIKYNYYLLIIMGISTADDTVRRDIVVYTPDLKLKNNVVDYLIKAEGSRLSLETLTSTISECTLLQQNNVSASRKVVLPMMEEWLKENI